MSLDGRPIWIWIHVFKVNGRKRFDKFCYKVIKAPPSPMYVHNANCCTLCSCSTWLWTKHSGGSHLDLRTVVQNAKLARQPFPGWGNWSSKSRWIICCVPLFRNFHQPVWLNFLLCLLELDEVAKKICLLSKLSTKTKPYQKVGWPKGIWKKILSNVI